MSLPPAFSKNSAVSIQLGFLIAIVGGAFYLGGAINDFKYEQKRFGDSLDQFSVVVGHLNEQSTNDRWSYMMMTLFGDEFVELNPDIKFPVLPRIREKVLLNN